MFRLFSRTTDAQGLCTSRLFDNETFYKTFTDDLRYAKRRVYICLLYTSDAADE